MMKQEFQGAVKGGIAGRNIINEAQHGGVHIDAISGGLNIVGQTGDIYLQVPAKLGMKEVIRPSPEHVAEDQKFQFHRGKNLMTTGNTKAKTVGHSGKTIEEIYDDARCADHLLWAARELLQENSDLTIDRLELGERVCSLISVARKTLIGVYQDLL